MYRLGSSADQRAGPVGSCCPIMSQEPCRVTASLFVVQIKTVSIDSQFPIALHC